ncbi:MAG: hypothetical protein ACD_54C00617G0002 [uncultured bacterium]|nr:MAG: hypothetical protein ACD_54C00617G0002 [uncultured bacterium]
MIFTVDPNLSASGVKNAPQTSPMTRHSTAAAVTHGSSRLEVCMNRFGFAYSQIDIPIPLRLAPVLTRPA